MRNLLLAILLSLPIFAQIGPPGSSGFTPVVSDPTGNSCQANSVALRTPNGLIYTCQNGHYALGANAPGTFTPSPSSVAGILSNGQLGASTAIKSVIDAGAKCDGSTNDQTALQTAFTAGGNWLIPQGKTCNHSGVITIPSNTNIFCEGWTAILYATDVRSITNSTTALEVLNASNVTIQGCAIGAAATLRGNPGTPDGIWVHNSNNVKITGNFLYGASFAEVEIDGASYNVATSGNTFSGSLANPTITHDSSHSITFENNTSLNPGDTAFEVVSYTADSVQTYDVLVTGNLCMYGAAAALCGANDGAKRTTFTNNISAGSTSHAFGCFTDSFSAPYTPSDCVIQDNVIYGTNTSYRSVYLNGVTDAVIQGNDIRDGTGIQVDHANANANINISLNKLKNITAGNAIDLPGHTTHYKILGNDVDTVAAGNCIGVSTTDGATSDADITANKCNNITVGNAGIGVIDLVGITGAAGTSNVVGTFATASGAIRFSGTTFNSSYDIGNPTIPGGQVVTLSGTGIHFTGSNVQIDSNNNFQGSGGAGTLNLNGGNPVLAGTAGITLTSNSAASSSVYGHTFKNGSTTIGTTAGSNAGVPYLWTFNYGITALTSNVTFSGLAAASGTPSSICAVTGTGQLTINAALTCTVSSRIFKTHIAPLALARPSLDFMKLKPAQFAYKDQPDRMRWGFIAEEAAAVDAKLGDAYDKDGVARSLDQNAILALTVKTVQEQQRKIESLESAIRAMKK